MIGIGRNPGRRGAVALTAAFALTAVTAHAAPPPADTRDIYTQMADEVADKVMATPVFQAKIGGGRKAKIVIGDVTNNSDDEGIRVEDIFNEIRNQIVSSGTARLFAPGELNVDFIISPELTSRVRQDGGRRRRCFTLNVTVSTAAGELITATNAQRCS
jgi:hypothetical protein